MTRASLRYKNTPAVLRFGRPSHTGAGNHRRHETRKCQGHYTTLQPNGNALTGGSRCPQVRVSR
jgi:hypothetical protein